MKIKAGITSKMFWFFSFICIACVLVTGIISYQIEKVKIETQTLDNLENLSLLSYDLLETSIDSSVKNYLNAIADVSYDIADEEYFSYLNGDSSFKDAKVATGERVSQFIIGETGYVFVLDSQGVVHVHDELAGQSLLEYEHVRKIIEMKNGYIEYFWKNPSDVFERSKSAYFHYYKPFDFYFVASSYKTEFHHLFSIDDFSQDLLDITIGNDGYIFVLDEDMNIVIHPNYNGGNKETVINLIGEENANAIKTNLEGVLYYDFTDIDTNVTSQKIMAYRHYEPMNWIICASVFVYDINQDAIQSLYITTSIMAGVIVIMLFASLVISKQLFAPIVRLNEVAQSVSDGRYDIKIETKRSDEIGDLVRDFGKMTLNIKYILEKLKSVNGKLKAIKLNLEEKVQERTDQLWEEILKLEKESRQRKVVLETLIEKKTELEIRKKELEIKYVTDGLTKLFNRYYLFDFLEHKWKVRAHNKIIIMMIDIDFFKLYNDTYGHVSGDQCLISVAQCIEKTVEEQCNINEKVVARYGGEEFIVVLYNDELSRGNTIANEIVKNVKALEITHEKSTVSEFVTVSAGVYAVLETEIITIEKAIDNADQALYMAKENGRNCVRNAE